MTEGTSQCSTVPPHPYGEDVKRAFPSVGMTRKAPSVHLAACSLPTRESVNTCTPKKKKRHGINNVSATAKDNTCRCGTSQDHSWWRRSDSYHHWNGNVLQTDIIFTTAIPHTTTSSLLSHVFRDVPTPQTRVRDNDAMGGYYLFCKSCSTEERRFWPTHSRSSNMRNDLFTGASVVGAGGAPETIESSPAWYEVECEPIRPLSLVQPYNIIDASTAAAPVRETTVWDLRERGRSRSKGNTDSEQGPGSGERPSRRASTGSSEGSNVATSNTAALSPSVSTETKCWTPSTPTSPKQNSGLMASSTPASTTGVPAAGLTTEFMAAPGASVLETRDFVQTPPASSFSEQPPGITLERLMRAVRSARERAKQRRQRHEHEHPVQ